MGIHSLTVEYNHNDEGDQKELLLPAIRVHLHKARRDAKEHENREQRAQHLGAQRHMVAINGIQQQECGARYGRRQGQVAGEALLQRRQLLVRLGHVQRCIAELVFPILQKEEEVSE